MGAELFVIVAAWFAVVSDTGAVEKWIVATGTITCVALLFAAPSAGVFAWIGLVLLGIYVCLRMTYLHATS